VVVIGVEHTKTPFDILERVTVGDAEVSKVLAQLSSYENVREVALVSTCLRTEIYAVVDRFHDAVDDVTALLADRAGCSTEVIESHESVFFDRGAAAHLFKIASGLASAVPGETEVLGQVRRSLDRSVDEGTAGPLLSGLFRHAIQAGRRVRTETGISRGTTSFSHAAVAMAMSHLGDDFEGAEVVVLGAGGLASGTLASLVDARTASLAGITIVNRTVANAEQLAERTRGEVPISVAGLDSVATMLADARLLICAAEADTPLVQPEHLAARDGAPLLIVDLGMPRNVDHEVGQIPGVELMDISDLSAVIEAAVEDRRAEVSKAEEIVADEVSRYLEDQRGRGAAPVVVALREKLDAIRSAELERRRSDLASLTDDQREAVEAITRSMLAKLVHEPTMALKESAGTPRGERLLESIRILFDL
jgi:glutamyl-tRNA reductase